MSEPGDELEREADRMADEVMRAPDGVGSTDADRSEPLRFASSAPLHAGRGLRDQGTAAPASPGEHAEGALSGSMQPGAKVGCTTVQRSTESIDEDRAPGGGPSWPDRLHAAQSAGGETLVPQVRTFMEPRFGTSFGHVRVHRDETANALNRDVRARAFTVGHDVFFRRGEFEPSTERGRHLIAHELAHVVQQGGLGSTGSRAGHTQAEPSVQAQHQIDTGWRYTPPSTVTRTITEIQGIVGATPDGSYGPTTREFVRRYQTRLKAEGLYDKETDGKWGAATDVAHVAFALSPGGKRESYNCAGFAFKTYRYHSQAETESILSGMTRLPNSSSPCSPHFHKFWYWKFQLRTTDLMTGMQTAPHDDFHIIGGQTDKKGAGPDQVMSKNGPRPVEGPRPPDAWKVVTGPAPDAEARPSPRYWWTVTNTNESIYCNKGLP